jgi:ribose transport system substrate-binding protein
MKNVLRKPVLVMMAVLLLLSVVTGCKGSSETAASESPKGTPAASNAAVASTTGKADKFPEGKKLKIGIASREILNDFNRGIIEGATNTIKAAGGEVVVSDGQGDPGKHNENISNLINSGVDGIIISLGDAQQLAPVVAKAKEKNIPVVTTSIGAKVDGAITDVGGDEPLMASMMARALLMSIDYKGDVYVFWVPGAPLLETRKRILEAIVKDYPAVKLHEVPTEHNPAKVQTQMEDLLTANPNKGSIAGVWAAYDLLGSGASEAIRKAGRNEIKMTAIDGDRVGFQMLFQEGSPFVATVAQDVNYIGTLAAQSIIKVSNGMQDQISGTTFTNAYLATRHNGVKAAEMRWGARFWDDVKMKKEDVEKKLPQTDEVIVVRPIAP